MVRRIAVMGVALVAVMQVYFVVNGRDRPAAYVPVQAISAMATLAAAWGVSRLDVGGAPWVAVGFGVNALMRLLQVVLSLTRLPVWVNLVVAVSFLLAAVAFGLHAARPRGHARLRRALVALTAAHFVFFLFALSSLVPAFGLAMECAGFALAAAFLE